MYSINCDKTIYYDHTHVTRLSMTLTLLILLLTLALSFLTVMPEILN